MSSRALLAPFPSVAPGTHLENGGEVQGVRGVVVLGDDVQAKDDREHEDGKEEDGQEHGLLPLGGLLRPRSWEELPVVRPGRVARHQAGQGVGDDDGGDQLAPLLVHVPVQWARDGPPDHDQDQGQELAADAVEGREEHQVQGRAEDVSMDLFPAGFFADPMLGSRRVAPQVLLGVARKVVPESSEQNEADQAAEEDDHHRGIEDGEPVDLVSEEINVQVTVETVGEGRRAWDPGHLVREIQIGTLLDPDQVLARHVHFDNVGPVVPQAQLPVRVDGLGAGLVRLSDHAPDRKVVQVELVPVPVVHSRGKGLGVLCAQFHRADLGLCHILRKGQEVPAVHQFMSLQLLAERVAPPPCLHPFHRFAEWQIVVFVCLVRVVVRTHFVHPQRDLVTFGVLMVAFPGLCYPVHQARANEQGECDDPPARGHHNNRTTKISADRLYDVCAQKKERS